MTMIHSIPMIIILLYLCHLAINSQRYSNAAPTKMVIDTDAGGDDALAIMLALMYEAKTHDIEILAITCTYGNTYVENVEENVLKILTIANRSDIPVYSGSKKSLINTFNPEDYFGVDGFGDFNFTQTITAKLNKTKHASVLLVDLVKQYPGEITLVNLGPLTNIGLAIALEPHFLHLVKEHVIMGSSVRLESNSTEGDKIEFNFKQDPESNWIAFNNTDKPSNVLPLDAVHRHRISKEEYRNIFSNLDESIASFLYQAERLGLEKTDTWEPSDGIAMATALKSEIVTQSFETNLSPVISGDARGSVEINFTKKHNAKIITDLDVAAFKNLLIRYLS